MCCGCQYSVVEGPAQQHALSGLVHTTDFISGYDYLKIINIIMLLNKVELFYIVALLKIREIVLR